MFMARSLRNKDLELGAVELGVSNVAFRDRAAVRHGFLHFGGCRFCSGYQITSLATPAAGCFGS